MIANLPSLSGVHLLIEKRIKPTHCVRFFNIMQSGFPFFDQCINDNVNFC